MMTEVAHDITHYSQTTYKIGSVHDLVLDGALAINIELQLDLLLLGPFPFQLPLWLLLLTFLLQETMRNHMRKKDGNLNLINAV